MPYVPLDIAPGIVKTRSAHAARGRYVDSDKIRFINGKPEKWAGWTQLISGTLLGMCRGVLSWANLNAVQNLALGTHLKLYAIEGGETLVDITPIRSTGTLGNNPFSTTQNSPVVAVNHSNHGAIQNDFVTYAGATAVAGLTLNGQFQITSFIDNNNYQIIASSSANATTTGGGNAVTFSYQINTGSASGVIGLGWGAGTWGQSTWGTPRTSGGVALDPRIWFLSNYGADLLSLPAGGGLYLWDQPTQAQAVVVANAPTSARAMFVTPERFVFLLGTTTPMTVQWPDQNDITNWTPAANNTANIRTLQNGSKLIAGTALTDFVSLVWSDTSLYVFQYSGSDFVYDDIGAGKACGLIGPLAQCVADNVAYWMSGHDFHLYNGNVGPIQNAEDVRAFVFNDLDPAKALLSWAVYEQATRQIRWHYCSAGSVNPNKYVDVSLIDYSWTVGTIDRTAGAVFRPNDGEPVMVDSSGLVYLHGNGLDANGSAINSFVKFGLYALGEGEQNVDVFGFVPDTERQTGPVTIEMYSLDRPNSSTQLDSATLTFNVGDDGEDVRMQARHFSFTLRSNVLGGDFRLGIPAVHIEPAGERE
jgi:hypothetical protein